MTRNYNPFGSLGYLKERKVSETGPSSILNSNKASRFALKFMCFFAMLFVFNANAQNALPYTFTQATGSYTPLTGGTSFQSGTTLNTNAVSAPITIPFTFTFNGVGYTSLIISNNGFVTFGATAPTAATVNPISVTTAYAGAISGYGFNLVASTVSGAAPDISYGTAGSDFVIQFTDLARTGITGDRMSFQIRLTQTTNVVSIVYNNWAATTTTTAVANFGQVGMRGATNTAFLNRMVYATAPYNTWATSGGGSDNGATALQAISTSGPGGPNCMRYNNAYLPANGLTYTYTPVSSAFYQALPYSQNFESWSSLQSVNDVPGTGVITNPASGNLSTRAHNETLANSVWGSTNGGAAATPGASQGTKCARFHSYDSSSGLKGYMDFYLNFSAVGAKQLTFDLVNTTSARPLKIYLSTDGGVTFGAALANFNTTISAWTTVAPIALGTSTSSTCVVRFEFQADFAGASDIGVDNVNVSVPSCSTPSGVTVTQLTATTASVSWTGASSAVVEWGTSGCVAGSNASAGACGNVLTAGSSPQTITGLSASTTYSVYVRQDCTGSGNGYSSNASTSYFNPPTCPAGLGAGSVTVSSIPYSVSGQTNSGAGNNVTSTNVACVAGSTSYYGGEDKTFIFTPTVTGVYTILLTTATDDDAGIMLYQGCPFTPGSTCVANAQGTTGLTRTLTPTLTNGVTYYLVVDNFPAPAFIGSYSLSITPPPTCGVPTGLAVSDITGTTADIAWVAPTLGTAATYDWEIRTSGAGGSGATGLTTSGNTASTSVNDVPGLASKTAYNLYVKTNCTGADGSSTWAGPIAFSTLLDCGTAIVLTANTTETSGNLATAGGIYNPPATTCGFSTPGNEKLYSFTSTAAGTYTLEITSVTGSGYIDYFFKAASGGCGSTGWTCIGDANAAEINSLTLAASTTYFILLDAESASSTANQTFKIVPPPSCTGAVGGTASGSTTVCGSVTPSITATGYSTGIVSTYQWEYSNDNFVSNINDFVGQTTPATLTTGLVSTTTYYRLRVTCDSGLATAYSNVVSVVVNPVPAVTTVSGAGTFCTSTTIAATNGNDGTMYFQGTISGGTSTATPSSSETITTSGIYYFRAQNPTTLCWGSEGSVTVIIQQPAGITGTDATICQGGTGTIAAVATNCNGFVNSGTTLSGTFTATDSQANRPNSLVNSSSCGFSSVLRGYQTQQLQVSTTGTYTFDMTSTDDGMAYITTGAFTPGSCATGTWIKGDDDSGPGNDPQLSMTLTAGVTYTLYSTTYSLSNGNSTAAYSWTITPPSGGQIMLPGTGVIEWYTSASGGSPIATGSPLNPVGVAGSGLADTNTAGTTTYYAACSLSNVCRTPVNFVINANVTYYQDADNDGFGNLVVTQTSCTGAPSGYVTNSLDCNDNQIQYADVDGDGFGSTTQVACGVANSTDCNDNQIQYADADGDGFGSINQVACGVANNSDCNDNQIQYADVDADGFGSTTQVACGVTNNTDCNDNQLQYFDGDGDNYGTAVQVACGVVNTGDCNDSNSSVHPGATEICYDGIDNNCDGTIDEGCTPIVTVVQGSQCGSTLATIDQYIYANLVAGAQGYRFKVTDMTTNQVQTIDKALRVFQLTQLGSYAFNRTYQVEVSVRYANVWQPFYGLPCTVTTPATTTQVQAAQCGSTLTNMTDIIYANNVPFSAGYKFRITNLLTSAQQEIERPVRDIRMSTTSIAEYNTTYSIEVAVKNTNGTYLPYGTPCNITTPSFPTSQLQLSQCDVVITNNATTIYADSYSGASTYRFRFTNGAFSYSFDRPTRSFVLSTVPGLLPATTYSVQVALEINGVFGPFGKVCTLTTPGSARTVDVSQSSLQVMTYPNPFADNFKLDVVTTSEEVINVKVYDMLGKLVENRNVEVNNIDTLEVGSAFPSGVYNVIVSQGNEVKTQRVIKR